MPYMKKILIWKNITGIITVLTFSFLIYDRWYKIAKVDKIKSEISAHVYVIHINSHNRSVNSKLSSGAQIIV